MRYHIVVLSLCFLAGLGSPGSAQNIPVKPGDLVRVHIVGRAPIEGFVRALDAATLSLTRNDMRRPVVVPTHAITSIERGDVVGHRGGHGAVIGAGIGAGLGLLLSALATAEQNSNPWSEVSGGEVVGATMVLAGLGAATGAIIGSVSARREWHRLDIGRQRDTPLSIRAMGRAVIGLSVSF